MESRTIRPRRSPARLWISTGVLLATSIGSALVLNHAPAGDTAARAAAAVAALGTLACAVIGAPVNPYPRWGYWAAAALLAGAVLASPFTAVSTAQWAEQTRDSIWMAPWFFVVLTFLPTSTRGVCAPQRASSGFLLAGSALLLATMLKLSTRLRPLP